MITVAIPPALPACLGIGITFAISNLNTIGVKCIDRDAINLSGQVDLVCFDKTGTLTEDDLDLKKLLPVSYDLYCELESRKESFFVQEDFDLIKFEENLKDSIYFFNKSNDFDFFKISDSINSNESNLKIDFYKLYFVECMATCHSLTKINNKILGDLVEVKIFEKLKNWFIKDDDEETDSNLSDEENKQEKESKTFSENKKDKDAFGFLLNIIANKNHKYFELGIIKKFEFSSELQRMSVIVKNLNENFYKIYTKGSPEKIRKLSIKETIPNNFEEILEYYTNNNLNRSIRIN